MRGETRQTGLNKSPEKFFNGHGHVSLPIKPKFEVTIDTTMAMASCVIHTFSLNVNHSEWRPGLPEWSRPPHIGLYLARGNREQRLIVSMTTCQIFNSENHYERILTGVQFGFEI